MDSLLVKCNKLIEGHYENCTLYAGYTDSAAFLIAPGTYNLKIAGIIGEEARIEGESKTTGWVLKILSTSGAVLVTTENSSYHPNIHPTHDTTYVNSIIVQYK